MSNPYLGHKDVSYKTLTSDGRQITSSSGNHIIKFFHPETNINIPITILRFETFVSGCKLYINDEIMSIHHIDPDSILSFEDIKIWKITIIEPNIEYKWTAII